MNCGNCGKSNDYDAKVCVQCGSTLALTEYFRPTGFVEKKNSPKKPKKEPWDQEILTDGYKKKKRTPPEGSKPREPRKLPVTSDDGNQGSATGQKSSEGAKNGVTAPKTDTRSQKTGTTSKPSQPVRKEKGPKSQADSSKGQTKAPNSRVYNHTTKKLSIAEKTVKKTEKKKGRKWIFPIILFAVILFAAAAIFVGTMNAGTREDRFTQVAEDFVTAVVMSDETKAADCVHPKMYGSVRPMDYDNAQRCEANAYTMEQLDPQTLEQELADAYGITDPITELYRIRVGYTVYGEQTYGATMTMDVLVAQIGSGIYAVKTENASNIP